MSVSHSVVILSPLISSTGNKITAERIAKHLTLPLANINSNPHFREEPKGTVFEDPRLKGISTNVSFVDSALIHSKEELSNILEERQAQVVFALHAYRSGRLLSELSIPFVLILGGTDVNEDVSDKVRLEVMEKALRNARFIVAFQPYLASKCKKLWPFTSNKLQVIPPSVDFPAEVTTSLLPPHSATSLPPHDHNHLSCSHLSSLPLPSGSKYFLVVAGLREVKDPLFIIEAFQRWNLEDNSVYLIIIGPTLDALYAQKVQEMIKERRGVLFLGDMKRDETMWMMRGAAAVINTSISEGCANVLLESMALHVPIIARKNEGNSVVVEDNVSGLMFDTPRECIEKAKTLLSSPSLRHSLTSAAAQSFSLSFSLSRERSLYLSLLSHSLH